MKLLIDMNLPPSWVDRLAAYGLQSVHWSAVGSATATDSEVLAWARAHERVLVTHDLDFSAILAASAESAPSVMQVRSLDPLSADATEAIARAARTHRQQIEQGALLSIDGRGARVRIFPSETRPLAEGTGLILEDRLA